MPKYPFNPAILDAMPEEMAELFRGLELRLLEEICSRLKIADTLNEVTVQDIRALRSHGIDLDEITKAIQEIAGISKKKMDELLQDVVERNQEYYGELIDIAKVTRPQTIVDLAAVEAIKKQALDGVQNITRSLGFILANGQMLPPAMAYQWALDSAILQVESGGISYNEAIASAIRQLADSGLCVAYDKDGNILKNHVQYKGNRHNQVDVAVRRAVMTGINQLNQQYREQSMDYLETDLVEVTAHVGARNIQRPGEPAFVAHTNWQGKIFRWAIKPKTSIGRYPDFETSCGYGDIQGIGGINCRHSFWPFIEGVMERTYTDSELANIDPPPFVYDGKTYTAYEATQMQRSIERAIREQKRRQASFRAAGLDKEATAAGAKLRRLNAKYTEFSAAAGLPKQMERIRVLYE